MELANFVLNIQGVYHNSCLISSFELLQRIGQQFCDNLYIKKSIGAKKDACLSRENSEIAQKRKEEKQA